MHLIGALLVQKGQVYDEAELEQCDLQSLAVYEPSWLRDVDCWFGVCGCVGIQQAELPSINYGLLTVNGNERERSVERCGFQTTCKMFTLRGSEQ